ncbi:endogenous retrovirus group FC1 Env polyprotein [Sciurus carolinensis]|uniref:endogenous retrovirus group FC1 Env polyprotein n=1 Tax=Sciurus carolinensis TaxID=30640 RepID=UPI001FB46F4D|nr:endogenous retrovirus group FC1 Env polyprotein [Sciurus carolinensis]XP_047412968.1 endogenous retrovirus group FC1 Env polyprotein [Sciurus carolinensis]XP_047412969.1 endogenous retrovirus group FC1 Env polyprotein [Sciurus carolinensis]XP_047412970.1 endogenous retrovirus group FC1 Env polyprotein [Sciurus carolinensis]
MSPALKNHPSQIPSPGPPLCWDPPNSKSLINPLLLLLLINLSQASIPTYRWHFYIQETWQKDGNSHSQIIAEKDCSSTGCDQEITFNLVDFNSIHISPYNPTAMACFLFDQTKTYCKNWPTTYGGCPYHQCKRHLVGPAKDPEGNLLIGPNGEWNFITINIKDPWAPIWASGADGKLYTWYGARFPIASLRIWRAYIQVVPQAHITIQEQEKEIQRQVNKAARPNVDPFSWLTLIHQGLQLLNLSRVNHITDCFLCAGLDRAPLTAIPINSPFNTSAPHRDLSPPLEGVPLFHDSSKNFTHCYTFSTSVPCNQTVQVSSSIFAPPGFFFWCNGTLIKKLDSNMPSAFCVPSTLVPQLTLYSEAELTWLAQNPIPRVKRAIFLPVVVGLSLASSFETFRLGAGGPGYAVTATQKLEQQLQEALEVSAASLASLQRQISSVAQVSLQNRRVLDLLMADKGGTCLFLREECCYYINETGLVEKNAEALRRLSERLKQQANGSWPEWLDSTLVTWLTPILTLILVIGLLLMIAPCLLRFVRKRMSEVAKVTYNQMLLHGYSRLPTEPTSEPSPHDAP